MREGKTVRDQFSYKGFREMLVRALNLQITAGMTLEALFTYKPVCETLRNPA